MNIIKKGVDFFLSSITNKFIRFILVGCLNTVFGYCVYCILIFIGLSFVWATLVSQIIGVLFNFMTTGTLVFENTDKRLLFTFSLSYIVTYFINIGVNKTLQICLGYNEYITGLGATIVAALCSFLILKLFVYRK